MLRKFNWLHSSSKKPRRLLIAFTVFSVMEVIKITRRGNVELFFSSGMHLIQGESSGWKRVWHGGLKPLSQTYTTQIWFFKKIIYLFKREGKGGRKRGEKHRCTRAISISCSHTLLTGDLACNPAVCPDWELNWWPFGLQTDVQSTKPYQPGQHTQTFWKSPLSLYVPLSL